MVDSPRFLVFIFCAACIFGLVEFAQAQAQTQNQTRLCTDPAEGVPLSVCVCLSQAVAI